MAQGDYNIQNQSFPSFRSDLNSTLSAINSSNSGTSRPSSAVEGTIWLDTTVAATPTLKFYDGSDDISLATIDYSANTVNWLDSTVVADLVNDTTPQLGGNLDVNGNSIVSVSNGNITFTPDGTGKVIIDGLSYPTADGTANQVLTTDGSGNLSFADASGGGLSWQSSIKTSTFTASDGEGYFVNTTGGAVTVNLPSGSAGAIVAVKDYAGTFGSNNLTISANGSDKINGSTDDSILSTGGIAVTLVFADSTQGWLVTDDGLQSSAPQNYNIDFLVIGGGASGGLSHGGGGGAGGYRTSTQTTSGTGTVITVTVGDGGAALSADSGVDYGNSGSSSSISGSGFTTITSAGGGGGASGQDSTTLVGQNGGSGGGGRSGGSGTVTGGSGNTPSTSPSQGNNGGSGYLGEPEQAGGGGGAGAVGDTGSSGTAADGGAGASSSITGSAVTRAGGGGGGARSDGTAGSGGSGGGGNASSTSANASAGTVNTGGGGGGGGRNNGGNMGDSGAGGKGVVILSVPTTDYSGTTSGSPTVTTSGSNTIMQFNSSGSYTT